MQPTTPNDTSSRTDTHSQESLAPSTSHHSSKSKEPSRKKKKSASSRSSNRPRLIPRTQAIERVLQSISHKRGKKKKKKSKRDKRKRNETQVKYLTIIKIWLNSYNSL